MKGFIPLKRGECPICNGAKKDCRESTTSKMLFCRESSATPSGYIFRGCDKWGFGMWQPSEEAEAFAHKSREEWQQEQEQRRLERERQQQQQIGSQLSAADRHKSYSKILDQLPLREIDRADLERRRFTAEQIDADGYRSVEQWQQILGQFPSNLPGLLSEKRLNSQPGYIFPVKDINGLIIALSIRLRDGENGRYRWLTSATKKNPEGATPHLDGELPLSIFEPSEYREDGIIWLTEGLGIKPSLTRYRLEAPVLGASSGLFSGSPNACKVALEKLSAKYKTKRLVVPVDAGDVKNPHVSQRWKREFKFLQGLGYDLQIAWWGQFDKSDPDIDELESIEAIEFITPKQFFDIANHAKQQAEKDEKLRQERLKREAEDAIYQQLTTIQEKPWKIINTPRINLDELLTEPGAIYIVSSPKGTHKTNALVPVVASHDRVLAWFNRVALGREECNRVGLTWKDDASSYSNKNKRGFCADSSFQFDPKILSDKGFLLGDECDQVFAHIFGSTCNKDGKRPLILATLEAHIDAAIHGGGMALFMSADVTQRDIDYLKALAPEGCPVRLIVNEYKPDRGIVYFDISDNPDGKIEELLMTLEEGTPCFLIDDIKNGVRGCKSIAEYVRTVHPEWASKIVEINSDTSGDPFVIDYLKNINKASTETLLLSCSPSVVSGISIENGHFGGVFALLNGILTVSDASQAIARVRGAEEINLWAAEQGLAYEANRSTDPNEIKDWYRRNYEANCKHLLSFRAEYEPITGEWGSPHFDLFCKNAAYRNLCMSRLRERLETRLEEEGYDLVIQEDAGSDMVETALKDCWNKIELTEARAIAAANLLSDAELEALNFKTTPLDPEEKRDLQKTLLLKWFGQELIEATVYEHDSGEVLTGYAAMVLKNERGVYRQQLDNFYLLTSDEGEAIGKDIAAETSQLKHNNGRFPGDIRWRSRQRKARAWLGLPDFLNPEKWYEPSDYRAMGQKAKSKAPMIKDCLNLTVDNISDSQIVTELMQQLGLGLDKQWAAVKKGQRRFKRRRISAQSWRYAQMYVAHQQQLKADREASPQVAQEGVCQSDHPPQNIYTESSFRGGVITEESQVEICDSECASLITPPSIYIQPSFLGGGDQDLSQEVRDLVKALPFAESPEDFACIVEDSPRDAIEQAIARQPDQPRCQKLTAWYEAAKEAWLDTAVGFLQEAISHGAETIQAVLSRWKFEERWEAVLKLGDKSLADMERLAAIAPNWSDWCDA
jgi:hypothetical protein